jgi:L-threonylcarbamoyladenylate synthase
MRKKIATVVVKVDPKDPDPKAIAAAAKAIRRGALVAFPTETVYGVAANLLDRKAVDRLYEAKKRFRGKPFTVHIADAKAIRAMGCAVTKKARRAIDRYWPGPLTIILKSKDGRKVGFRMPANRVALELLRAAAVPVAAPSANTSGEAPPTDADSVLAGLDGAIEMLLDSGPTEIGVESTVVDLAVEPPRVLREGAVKARTLLKFLTEKR